MMERLCRNRSWDARVAGCHSMMSRYACGLERLGGLRVSACTTP
jgi:hypothetical protein